GFIIARQTAYEQHRGRCGGGACGQTRFDSLAGCGKGADDPTPDDASKVKLRRQALDWLNAELAAWSKILESGPPQARPIAAWSLKHWKEDGDLAGMRDAAALAKLPQEERAACKRLWAEVDGLLSKAGDRK
ncbi:MAG: hypothetical protein KGM43_18905, partial [Planctomycetota bacterium]|nr:hypothetical protein [Planctomycetota bacterium]